MTPLKSTRQPVKATSLRSAVCCSLLAVAGIVATTGWNAPVVANEESSKSVSQQVVVHLSHFTDDLHRSFMALKLATLMQKAGAEVTVFLDLEGVRIAERRQPLDITWGSSKTTLAEHYEHFTKAGGKVVLCPHCAKSARIGEMALRRQSQIATEESLGKMLLDAEKILDY